MSQDAAYQGYLIKLNPFDGLYYVSKGGFHIATADSLEAAKADIRLLTGRPA